MNKIELRGEESEVYNKIANLCFENPHDIKRIITFLEHNTELLCSDEQI